MPKVDISVEKLLEYGAHFGHQYRRWNPKMKDYLYKAQDGVYVFDLFKTKESLEKALDVISEAASKGKTILMVGSKKQFKDKAKEVAEDCGILYVVERWPGGTFTNFDQIKKTIDQLKDTKAKFESGSFDKYTKKERLLIDRKIRKQERLFGGILSLTGMPDLMIILDTHKEIAAVKEALKVGIEMVGIVDSNTDPTLIDWPIPMNDDSPQAVSYVLDLIADTIKKSSKSKKTTKK